MGSHEKHFDFEGIEVIEFEAIKNAPDAIFPNWFTTYATKH
jgi:hypothetical protein